MARFVLLLLVVIAGMLVVALFRDRRGRREARFDGLRWAFLHGRPQPGSPHPASLTEIVHPAGVRFRAPASWTVELRKAGGHSSVAASDRGRRVEVDVVPLDGVASGSVTEALERLPARGERSLEALPNGNVLMKSVEAVRGPGGALAAYTWRLGRAAARGGLQMAEFRLCLPVETAAEVIAQADLATLDREVREAAFADGTDAPSAA